MLYSKEIRHRDLTIYFDYEFKKDSLILSTWDATEPVPCAVESEFIEKKLDKWLEEEYSKNGSNYHSDLVDFEQEKRYYKSYEE